jgi:hypothetical protein
LHPLAYALVTRNTVTKMFLFNRLAGQILRGSDSESLGVIASAYSGYGEGKNNPSMQNVANVGPLPSGWYTMETIMDDNGNAIEYEDKMPPVIRLIPDTDTEMFGRAGMLMHGDFVNPLLQGTASHGCIVEDHTTRAFIASCIAAGDNRLHVI